MRRGTLAYIGILVLLLSASSCSVSRRIAESRPGRGKSVDTEKFVRETRESSVTKGGFRIDKIRVSANIRGDIKKFNGNLKYDSYGSILLSIRAIAGIEIARVFINKERVIVLDRFNREFSEGSSLKILRDYGMEWNDLIMIFGNIPEMTLANRSVKCVDGIAVIEAKQNIRNFRLEYNCDTKRLNSVRITNGGGKMYIIDYIGINEIDKRKIPGEINLKDEQGTYDIHVEFDKPGTYLKKIEIPVKPSGYTIGVI